MYQHFQHLKKHLNILLGGKLCVWQHKDDLQCVPTLLWWYSKKHHSWLQCETEPTQGMDKLQFDNSQLKLYCTHLHVKGSSTSQWLKKKYWLLPCSANDKKKQREGGAGGYWTVNILYYWYPYIHVLLFVDFEKK